MNISILDLVEKENPFTCIDYEDPGGDVDDYLVDSSDTLDVVLEKAQKNAKLVLQGKSIAAALGETNSFAEEVANSSFTVPQKRLYDLWRTGCDMPKQMKWSGKRQRESEDDCEESEDGPSAKRMRLDENCKNSNYSEVGWVDKIALAEIFKLPSTEADMVNDEDVAFFREKFPQLIPLLEAMVTLVCTRNGLGNNKEDMSKLLLQREHDASTQALDAIEKQVQYIQAHAKKHFAQVERYAAILRERVRCSNPANANIVNQTSAHTPLNVDKVHTFLHVDKANKKVDRNVQDQTKEPEKQKNTAEQNGSTKEVLTPSAVSKASMFTGNRQIPPEKETIAAANGQENQENAAVEPQFETINNSQAAKEVDEVVTLSSSSDKSETTTSMDEAAHKKVSQNERVEAVVEINEHATSKSQNSNENVPNGQNEESNIADKSSSPNTLVETDLSEGQKNASMAEGFSIYETNDFERMLPSSMRIGNYDAGNEEVPSNAEILNKSPNPNLQEGLGPFALPRRDLRSRGHPNYFGDLDLSITSSSNKYLAEFLEKKSEADFSRSMSASAIPFRSSPPIFSTARSNGSNRVGSTNLQSISLSPQPASNSTLASITSILKKPWNGNRDQDGNLNSNSASDANSEKEVEKNSNFPFMAHKQVTLSHLAHISGKN